MKLTAVFQTADENWNIVDIDVSRTATDAEVSATLWSKGFGTVKNISCAQKRSNAELILHSKMMTVGE